MCEAVSFQENLFVQRNISFVLSLTLVEGILGPQKVFNFLLEFIQCNERFKRQEKLKVLTC